MLTLESVESRQKSIAAGDHSDRQRQDLMDFSEKLQKLRQDRNLTQEQLANELFVSRAAISKWESARGYPSIDSLKAISKLFSISIDELLSGEELITIAETETAKKVRDTRTIVFGILDCMVMLFAFLPLFAQEGKNMIVSVSLISFTKTPMYIREAYIIWTAVSSLWGILTLALQSYENPLWRNRSTALSLGISILGVIMFIISRQPYPAVVVFFFLLLKGILLIKR